MLGARREQGLDPATGIVIALVAHIALFFAVDWIDPPKPPEREIIVFEVAELPEEKKPEPEPPKPEPEPEPEPLEQLPEPEQKPEPEVKPKEPPRKKPPVDPKPEPESEPNPDPAPPPKRFTLPPSQLVPGGGGGVQVAPGAGGSSSGSGGGTPGGTGKKPGGTPGGTGTDPKPSGGTPWSPKGDLYIAQQPRVKSVPEYECPAVSERQVSGTVVLLVQVQRDGKVRSARTSGKKFGYGCDEIARKALLAAKFAPAMGTDGKAADYELRYEYVFELRD
jgi:TonB family protein